MKLCLFLIFVSMLPSWAKECQPIDHSKLWTKAVRNQCHLSSCHAFATLALLEAKIAATTGEKVDLSERDLYTLQLTSQNSAQKQRKSMKWSTLNNRTYQLVEGATPLQSWSLLQSTGVCEEETRPYEELFNLEAFCTLKTELQEVFQNTKQACFETQSALPKANLSEVFELVCQSRNISQEVEQSLSNFLKEQRPSRKCNKERDKIRNIINQNSWKLVKIERGQQAILEALQCQPLLFHVNDYQNLRDRTLEQPINTEAHHALVGQGHSCRSSELLIRNSWGKQVEKVPLISLPPLLQDNPYRITSADYDKKSFCEKWLLRRKSLPLLKMALKELRNDLNMAKKYTGGNIKDLIINYWKEAVPSDKPVSPGEELQELRQYFSDKDYRLPDIALGPIAQDSVYHLRKEKHDSLSDLEWEKLFHQLVGNHPSGQLSSVRLKTITKNGEEEKVTLTYQEIGFGQWLEEFRPEVIGQKIQELEKAISELSQPIWD